MTPPAESKESKEPEAVRTLRLNAQAILDCRPDEVEVVCARAAQVLADLWPELDNYNNAHLYWAVTGGKVPGYPGSPSAAAAVNDAAGRLLTAIRVAKEKLK